ncbi:Type-4 uracil-DNA glycosylase [Candidatus Hydrogenisulfobacillus filiaventi]|uniref:Type-4 uracil-DNA glycosylase n=1 Tax=Candidatus Hydrogenisulfobacillus filiaventi TaxID=2707344 RepID=A0A6F8ZHP4_9FIRM|nr:uracil-DNA glycosylase [Bacillota bacterium]CAB1129284.1 Type-4 uracil-DNA glycosylase [Candidatus Hydrogenisulfobacillus filiaventi]
MATGTFSLEMHLARLEAAHDLAELREVVRRCEACPLARMGHGPTFGEGVPGSALLLIGEAPGEEEDRQGRPFVGRAGQLLDRILEAAGFSRTRNVYITNVVKCRPPGNRVPTPAEQAACRPNLLAELRRLHPRIVVLLGRTALGAMLKTRQGITQARGHWVEHNGVWLLPTYHPAALLRNPALKTVVWDDFRAVVAKYREVVDPGHQGPAV